MNILLYQSVYYINDIDVSSLSSENMRKYIVNTKMIQDKLARNEKKKEPNQSFILEEVYASESTNSKSTMKTGSVEKAINVEVDGVLRHE